MDHLERVTLIARKISNMKSTIPPKIVNGTEI